MASTSGRKAGEDGERETMWERDWNRMRQKREKKGIKQMKRRGCRGLRENDKERKRGQRGDDDKRRESDKKTKGALCSMTEKSPQSSSNDVIPPPPHFSIPLTTGVACLCSSLTHIHAQSNVQPSEEAGERGNAKCLLPWLLPVAGHWSTRLKSFKLVLPLPVCSK